MGLREIAWRFEQKCQEVGERRRFFAKVSVCSDHYFSEDVQSPDWSVLGINFDAECGRADASIELLADYPYDAYKDSWHAGFQSEREWPLVPSCQIKASSVEVPGDLRTNWELNRHLQFAVLAKCYYLTGDKGFLEELRTLFDDWNAKNPFLWGPEWTSAMEIGIRLINWGIVAAFLNHSNPRETFEKSCIEHICRSVSVGCANMAAYIQKHRSRYSSANNHAIVEAAALGIAGYVFRNNTWCRTALDVMDRELLNQTHPDGVNKEQSLHYQVFSLEAYALYLHVRESAGEEVPEGWSDVLEQCCNYVCNCRIESDVFLEFGDDDEGCILNLDSKRPCHYECVLAFLSLQLSSKYRWIENPGLHESMRWLFSSEKRDLVSERPLFEASSDITYPNGGVTLMRGNEGRVVVGIDHGPLGFGPLAAHGHADALSFQVYIEGKPVFVDPGTFLYNGNNEMRDLFRSTSMHNTVTVGQRDQSEIFGPFLWGRRAHAKIVDRGEHSIVVEHDGYRPFVHRRAFELTESELVIKDTFPGGRPNGASVRMLVSSDFAKKVKEALTTTICIKEDVLSSEQKWSEAPFSPRYGVLTKCALLEIPFPAEACSVTTVVNLGALL